jgi:hypothetical protein
VRASVFGRLNNKHRYRPSKGPLPAIYLVLTLDKVLTYR